ncbi:hypothetical protein [Qipengyuania sp. NPDC077563]|uniref:hypothetical protein n=1 Tax=Qipengyuania sp. NPDC077563 TaxID=3364497 RepID=UPI00384F1CA4
MDLNELLHAHQVAVMRASARGGSHADDGNDHFAKVAEYAERVRKLRDLRLAGEGGDPSLGERAPNAPQTIIYGTYAGDKTPGGGGDGGDDKGKPGHGSGHGGEDEGGQGTTVRPVPTPDEAPAPTPANDAMLDETAVQGGPVPDGEYDVGGKRYTDLDLAVSEHLRQMSDPGARATD